MREFLRNLLPHGLVMAVKARRMRAHEAAEHQARETDRQQKFERYCAGATVRKLQLGSGYRPIDGWFNTDLVPRNNQTAYLDVSERFPFAENTFDCIHCEHMIEHLPYPVGTDMLRECARVLKPAGVMRLATPNLRTLVDLCGTEKTDQQQRYIQFSVDRYLPEIGIYSDTFVLNNFFRNFGHQFIYDPAALQQALEAAGFTDVTPCDVGESRHDSLRGIDRGNRVPRLHHDKPRLCPQYDALPSQQAPTRRHVDCLQPARSV